MTVVQAVENSEQEITIEEAETHGLEAEVGEELGFQIFYLPEDREKAREQDHEPEPLRAHRRANGQAGHHSAGP
jgi:N utilization substance protein A